MNKPSVLPSGMRLVGDIEGDEDLVVFGDVDGEVRITGALIVEATGRIRGNVAARSVSVRGIVMGDATATEAIRVDDGACVIGDVHAPRVNVVKGARFRGHVHMTGDKTRRDSVVPRLRPMPLPPKAPRAEDPFLTSLYADTVPGTMMAEEEEPGPRRPPPVVTSLRRGRARRRDRRN